MHLCKFRYQKPQKHVRQFSGPVWEIYFISFGFSYQLWGVTEQLLPNVDV